MELEARATNARVRAALQPGLCRYALFRWAVRASADKCRSAAEHVPLLCLCGPQNHRAGMKPKLCTAQVPVERQVLTISAGEVEVRSALASAVPRGLALARHDSRGPDTAGKPWRYLACVGPHA